MSTAQESQNKIRKPARLVASILFVLVVGMGYAVSPQVEGAVGLPDAMEDEEQSPSACVTSGLVLSDCFMDF